MRQITRSAVLSFILLTTVAAASAAEQPMLGEPAPGFRLETLEGTTFDLAETRGEIVVVHFATSWCPFCNAEGPHLERLWQDYRERGVRVVTIDVRESRETTEAFAERWGFTFPTLLDADGAVAARYAPAGVLPDLPREDVPIAANLVIDREGTIRFYSLLDTASFDARLTAVRGVVEQLLAEEPPVATAASPGAKPASPGCGGRS
ncbi:MAG TPA: TlpA disulfide reductase family protein [Thermoanaerobaculia bacterium]|nr:TlpA disulfide reductase family protein [Thermoanaerobaculia bacterium]